MRYLHTGCGGTVENRKCLKCGKKWNIISWWLNPSGIRPDLGRPTTRKQVRIMDTSRHTSYAKWGDSVPGVPVVAGRLPNWPRWARILSSTLVVGLIVLLIWGFFLGGF